MSEEHSVEINEESYTRYTIILNINLGSSDCSQMKLETYFNDIEAYNCAKNLNDKIIRLSETNSPVSLSLICRNNNNEIVSYGLIGVVGIIHNIPNFGIIDTSEE